MTIRVWQLTIRVWQLTIRMWQARSSMLPRLPSQAEPPLMTFRRVPGEHSLPPASQDCKSR